MATSIGASGWQPVEMRPSVRITTPARRMSVRDAGFLYLERPHCPIHIGCVAVLEGLATQDDLAPRIEARLARTPRYGQRALDVPFGVAHPTWEVSAFNAFFFEMIAGRGWICIALVVFASWRPGKALLGALLFGAFDAFQVRLQQALGGDIPYQIFLMLPYVFSILALIVMSRRAAYPKALMVPYRKGER